MGSIKTAEGTCQSPLHTPGWVRWEELFKTEGGKNGLGYSNKKVVVRVFGSTILARRRLCRKEKVSLLFYYVYVCGRTFQEGSHLLCRRDHHL